MIQQVIRELERFLFANWFGATVAWILAGLVAVTGLVCVVIAVRVRRVRVTEKKAVQVELGLCACREERERGTRKENL